MISVLKKLFQACNKRLKRKIFFNIITIFFSALVEFINIGLIGFLLLLITDKDRVLKFFIENNISFVLSTNIDDLSKILALLVVLISICSGFLRSFCVNEVSNVSAEIGSFLNVRLFRNVLFQNVLTYYSLDKSKILNAIYNTNIAINTIIQPLFMILIGSFSFLMISIGILFFAPQITASLLILIIALYLLLSFRTKKILLNLSNEQNILYKNELSLGKDTLELFKEIKLKSNQEYFLREFERLDIKLRKTSAKVLAISQIPRFIFEAVGISLIGISAYLAILFNRQNDLLPTLGILLLAIQRLIPSAQQVYSSYTNARGSLYALNNILDPDFLKIDEKRIKRLKFLSTKKSYLNAEFKSLKLKNVYLTYDGKKQILKDINITINKGDKVGIVGYSGSGKSSLIDVLMTLIKPIKGEILFNDNAVKFGNISSLNKIRNLFSYVPQTVYLKNDSIKNNIIFNRKNSNKIDKEKINLSCEVSCLNDFLGDLKDGLNYNVGDNGSFLSGGQKQRVAIARSIYNDDKILFFDEATNALDRNTENRLLDQLSNKLKERTIILITHRPASLTNFNKIILMSNGEIINIGSFNYLKENSELFRKFMNKK